MQCSTFLLAALSTVALAQLPGVPQCAQGVVAPAVTACSSDSQGLIACLCGKAASFEAPVKAACSCADVNTALSAAKGFCPQLAFAPLDCSAPAPSSAAAAPPAAVSSAPAVASSSAAPAPIAPATSSTAAVAQSSAASSYSTPSTTATRTTVAVLSSVSARPTTAATNGTVTTSPPASSSVAIGSAAGQAVVQIGGIAAAMLAVLAL